MLSAQIFVCDQLTCKNIRGAKRWAAGEMDKVNQLEWVCEVPGKCSHCLVL